MHVSKNVNLIMNERAKFSIRKYNIYDLSRLVWVNIQVGIHGMVIVFMLRYKLKLGNATF